MLFGRARFLETWHTTLVYVCGYDEANFVGRSLDEVEHVCGHKLIFMAHSSDEVGQAK